MGGKRILVADDDPGMARMLLRMLAREGFLPLTTDSPERIFDLAADKAVEAVILDASLGAADGRSILQELRRSSALPIIVITGALVDEETRLAARRLGAQAVLQKPFENMELLAELNRSLASVPPG